MRLTPVALIAALTVAGCGGETETKVKKKFVDKEENGGKKGDGNDNARLDPSAFDLKFLSPTEESTPEGGSLSVEINPKNALPTATWSLFYAQPGDPVGSGTPIVQDIPISKTKVSWDTSFVSGGTYYLYAVMKNGKVSTAHKSSVEIELDGEGDGNRSPTVNVATPQGDDDLAPGQQVTIQFSGADPDGDELTYTLEFTTNDGGGWNEIESGLNADTTEYAWTIPGDAAETARYWVRVKADDGNGSTGTGKNPNMFGVTGRTWTYSSGDPAIQQQLIDNCGGCHSAPDPDPDNNNLRQVGGNEDLCPSNNDPAPDGPCSNFAVNTYANVNIDVNGDGAANTQIDGVNDENDDIVRRTRAAAADDPNVGQMPPSGGLDASVRDAIQLWEWQGANE